MQILCENRVVNLFRPKYVSSDTPLVLLLTGGEDSDAVWKETQRLTGRYFCLASLPVADWENGLSPWNAKKVFRGGRDFGRGADDTIQELTRVILPKLKQALECPEMPCIIAGYSLAGLFAIYALYRTAAFTGTVSASGSLWFPGFLDCTASCKMPRTPDRVYLSLGDREKNTKNAVMCQVEENTAALYRRFREQGIACIFELNPGSHFQEVEHRLARGIAWIVSDTAEGDHLS